MEIAKKYYDAELHDIHRALCVVQPTADYLTTPDYRDEEGQYHADLSVMIMAKGTDYRGDVLVCSAAKPEIPLHPSAVTCGWVELFEVCPVQSLTEKEWMHSDFIDVEKRPKEGFAWFFRNPRRVVEMPIKGKKGFYDIIVPKDDISEYPMVVQFGSEGWKIISRKTRNHKIYYG